MGGRKAPKSQAEWNTHVIPHSGTEAGGERVWAFTDPSWAFFEHCFESYFIKSRSQQGVSLPFPLPSQPCCPCCALCFPYCSGFFSCPLPTLASRPFPAPGHPRLSPLPYSLTAGVCMRWLHGRVHTVLIDMHMYMHGYVYVQVYICLCECYKQEYYVKNSRKFHF